MVTEPQHASTLLARVAAGEHEAVSDFYARYRPMITRTVLGLVGGDQALAEDVLQETALRLWRAGARFDPSSAAKRSMSASWRAGPPSTCCAVVASCRPSGLPTRRTPRHATQAARTGATTPPAQEQVLDADLVERAMVTLTDAHREVVTRAYLLDQSYTDIALGLGVPVATVRTRVFYGLRALRRALTDEGEKK